MECFITLKDKKKQQKTKRETREYGGMCYYIQRQLLLDMTDPN